MKAFQSILTHPATVRLGWTLLHFLWQGAAIAALLGIGLLVLRRARANTRYVVACAALLLMVAAPIMTYSHLAPSAVTPLPTFTEPMELPGDEPTEEVAVSAAVTDASFTPVPMEPTPLPPAPAPQPWHARAMGWVEAHLNWIVSAWFCGVILLSIRLLMGWLGVKRMRSSGVAASETMQERLNRFAQRLRVTRPVRLLESSFAGAPVVMGWLRPVVLFPASLLTQLSAEQLDAVLAHELAHVRRHDYLVNLLQAVVETLLFYHPAVHWVSRRVRVEREHACDDLAVSACGDSTSYVRALARLAEMNVATPRLVPGASGHLFTRIRRLLHVDTPRDNRASVWVGGAVLIAALLVCAVTLRASNASDDNADNPVVQDHEAETPPDYSAMFEMIGVDEGVRVPTAEEIKRLGLPWPTMPAEENAAYWFAKANKQLIESCKDSPEPPGSLAASEPYAGDAARFTQYVNKNGDVFTLLAEGMSPGRKFEVPQLMIKESRTPTLEMTLLADIRNLGRFVADNGFAAELQGKPAAAADQYLRCVDVGRMAQAEGELINHMVGIVIQDMGAANLDALVGNATLDQKTLRRIIARARHAEVSAENRLAMLRVEAAFARSIMAASPQQAKRFAKNYGAYIEAVENALAEPLPDLLKSAAETIKTLQAKYPKPAQTASGFLEILPQHHARINLRLRAIQIRAAIALYEMKHGDSPKTLSALVPDFLPQLPEDPFSGKPLRYELTPGVTYWNSAMLGASKQAGWKLWSVGSDLKDDGGTAADVDQDNWKGPDYIFTNKVRSNIDRRSGGKIKTLPTSKPAEQTSSAKLQFRLVDDSAEAGGISMKDPKSGETIYVLPEILMTEADIVSASIQEGDRNERPVLRFRLISEGRRKFEKITEENIDRRLAIIYEGKVISAPTIKSRISGAGLITGSDEEELLRIAELINRVQGTADKAKSANSVTRDIKFRSEERTDTGAICKWEVPAGVPVRLLTAWLTLEDGQIKETTGPGGRQIADQSYRMGVEWEWSVEDFKLWVSRGVRRFEDDSTNTSRVKAPTAWPRGSTFQSKAFTEPAVLSGEPTILWRGDWMRDGGIVKSVIFVVYAVEDDVQPNLADAIETARGH